MATFEEYMSQARGFNPDEADEGATISTIYDSLETSYRDAMEGSQGKIQAKDDRIKELESELSRVKQHNYDLVMSSPAPNTDDNDKGSSDSDSDSSSQGIDSLFKNETKNR